MSDPARCLLILQFSVCTALFASSVCPADEPGLLINEVAASNSRILADPQSEYDDWIEILNASAGPVDAGGMYLTDALDEPTKWQMPPGRPELTTIAAGGYLLVWADGDTEDEPGLHAGFSLDADGEEIGLFAADGATLIDAVTFREQTPDISFGRYPDAHTVWRQMASPSPGGKNVLVYDGFVADVQFSHDRGYYTAPFHVVLTTNTPGATIRYTMDGSEPGTPLARGYTGIVYTGPLEIDRTVCLRAIATWPGWRSSAVRTHTYIFFDSVLHQPSAPRGFPRTWGASSADYAMDPEIVNHPLYAGVLTEALRTHRVLSLVCDVDDLFDRATGIYANSQQEGQAWERPVSVEIIDPAGGPELHINAGLRIQGGASRSPSRPKHNLRLLFKGIYGAPKLRFPMIEGWPVRQFDTLVLRGGNGDSWFHPNTSQQVRAQYIRDQWLRDAQTAMGRLTAGQCYVHVYLNGLYWGLYHVIERPNAAFFAEHLGGEPEEYDVVQHKGGTVDGDRQAWNAMMAIANGGLASSGAYLRIQEYLDVPNLVDYMLVNFYAGNVDWDRNNWYGGRRRVPDAGFRFLSWDSERTFLRVNDNVADKDFDNQPTHVHQQLTANRDYRLLFADHVHRHFFGDGALTPESAKARWLRRAAEIRLALVAESARWGDNKRPSNPYTPDVEWQAELDFLCTEYFPARTQTVFEQLRTRGLYPNINAPVFHPQGGALEDGLVVTVNGRAGAVWYTTDGSDPRTSHASQEDAVTEVLVAQEAPKRVLVPTRAQRGQWWGSQPFDDSRWMRVAGEPGGIGYERGAGYESLISGDLNDVMYGKNTTCYIRIPFVPGDRLDDWTKMTLRVRYDDGFVAYFNGTEIARRNFEGVPSWSSRAAKGHPDAEAAQWESVDVSAFLDELHTGENLLAIHGLNASLGSSDFLICAELTVAGGGRAGEINPAAKAYGRPVILPRSSVVKARVLSGRTWSALNEAVFAVGPVRESLRITEIMYHPMDDEQTGAEPRTEFVELQNVGAATIDLNLVRFTEGVQFTFGPTELSPGEAVVVVEDVSAFRSKYGRAVRIAGQYVGRLDNGGERLRLEDAVGRTIADFAYDDNWYASTDGRGFSLVAVGPAWTDPGDLGRADAWARGAVVGGSPGTNDDAVVP